MFGKVRAARGRFVGLVECVFQSPCAGNMFGKHKRCGRCAGHEECVGRVSIPVCGEHVW